MRDKRKEIGFFVNPKNYEKFIKCFGSMLKYDIEPNLIELDKFNKDISEIVENLGEINMYKWSKNSSRKLNTCHKILIDFFEDLIKIIPIDLTILYGYRGKTLQNGFYEAGTSKKKFPHSKHNSKPSFAIDIAPYINGSVSWEKPYFLFIGGFILAEANRKGVKLRWGGSWSGNPTEIGHQKFDDLGHFELIL